VTDQRPLVFYDGLCGLCDRFVQFVLRYDRRGHICFAPLQGEAAERWLAQDEIHDLTSIVVLTAEGAKLKQSAAVAHVLQHMGGVWPVISISMRIVPAFFRDFFYRAVARVRYRVFGKFDACRLPSPSERRRFLD
jgi:predicted DCC family thiol-disulfide oxidoreductase YuxK